MCKSPLIGYPNGYTDSGKVSYSILPYREAMRRNMIKPGQDSTNPYGKPIEIPCGHCSECRLNYARKWSERCMLESQHHETSYFITLTYDNEHLIFVDHGDYHTATLVKSDFQLFMKRLRSSLDYPIRFYMCGEYGTHTKRPHYHAILFGLKLDDLEFYTRSPQGDNLYTSAFLTEKWQKGFVTVGEVTPASCSYVARYCMKKNGSEKEVYEKLNIQPEYTQMSLKPGIGALSYSPDIFRKGYECISTEKGGVKIHPPRYFEKWFEEEDPEGFKEFKDNRIRNMENSTLIKNSQTSMTYLDRLDSELSDLDSRISSLKRDL